MWFPCYPLKVPLRCLRDLLLVIHSGFLNTFSKEPPESMAFLRVKQAKRELRKYEEKWELVRLFTPGRERNTIASEGHS